MAGEDQRHQGVADLLVAERLAVLVGSRQEIGQDVFATFRDRLLPALLDEGQQRFVQVVQSPIERQPARPLEQPDGKNLHENQPVPAAAEFQDTPDLVGEIREFARWTSIRAPPGASPAG